MTTPPNKNIKQAAELLKNSKYTTAFTGAGISVESGIPPFRGDTGLWSKYDPIVLDINYFNTNPLESWTVIKEIFYDFFGKANPNGAHIALAKMENTGVIQNIITQNIDNLHQLAGSKTVYEFHGNSHTLICTKCSVKYGINEIDLSNLPLICNNCGGLVKPDFIFFGEGIPPIAYQKSIDAAQKADVFLIIGTTGEIMPASQIPHIAKQNGASIIEINPERSNFTNSITDIFIQEKATIAMNQFLFEI
ncbi:MAG: NAD-dependent deacylase [Bacteroidota bacterium]